MNDMVPSAANEEIIRKLIFTFYSRVKENDDIGPIFNTVIGSEWTEWQAHLETMVRFWCAVMGVSRNYRGNPMQAHMQIDALRPEHFKVWLKLFRETANEVCPAPLAADFIQRAEQIGRNLQYGLFMRSMDAG